MPYYLLIDGRCDAAYWTWGERPGRWKEYVSYRLPVEGYRLLIQRHVTPEDLRGVVSGVFADWLEDHRVELLRNAVGAIGPSDPAQRLDALIDYLRSRFHSAA